MFWSPALSYDTLTLAHLPPTLAGPAHLALPPCEVEEHAADGVHRLLATGPAAQLWLTKPSEAGLGVIIPLNEGLPARLAAALDLWRRMNGQAPKPERLTKARRRRLLDGLRALDARADGASYREIARVLFPRLGIPSGPEWKASAVRARTMRLVADATVLMRGGYRDLLRRGRPAR